MRYFYIITINLTKGIKMYLIFLLAYSVLSSFLACFGIQYLEHLYMLSSLEVVGLSIVTCLLLTLSVRIIFKDLFT